MTRQRKIDEELWEDSDETLSKNHVIERFFAQHERGAHDPQRRPPPGVKPRRRPERADGED